MAKRTTEEEVNMENKNKLPSIEEKSKKVSEALKEVNMPNENNIPPCGCAIGDLFAIEEQSKKED